MWVGMAALAVVGPASRIGNLEGFNSELRGPEIGVAGLAIRAIVWWREGKSGERMHRHVNGGVAAAERSMGGRVTLLAGLARFATDLRRDANEKTLSVRRLVTVCTVTRSPCRVHRSPRLDKQLVDGRLNPVRMACRALSFSVRSRQRKDIGMREPSHGLEGMFLAMTAGTIAAIAPLVHVVVATRAVAREAQEPCVTRRERIEPDIGVTSLTTNRPMPSGEVEVEPSVIELSRFLNPRQRKRATVHELEFFAMMLKVTCFAVCRLITGEPAMKSC